MGTPLLLVTLSAFIVMVACLVLTLHKDYHTGVVGSFALGMIACGALARLLFIFEHHDASLVTPVALFIWVGMALHFAQLMVRFLLRLRGKGNGGTWYDVHAAERKAAP